jgi:hypothetical protein
MRKKLERLMISTIGTGLLVLLVPVFALSLGPPQITNEVAPQMSKPSDGEIEKPAPGMIIIKLARSLNLSKDQARQLEVIVNRYRSENAALREEMRLLSSSEIHGEAIDGTKEATLRSRKDALRTRQQESVRKMRTEVLSILTSDQRVEIKSRERDANAKREEKWEPRKKSNK